MLTRSRALKWLGGTVGALALAVSVTSQANAEALASGYLRLTDFQFLIGDENGQAVDRADLDSLSLGNNGGVVANLASVAGAEADFDVGVAGPLDLGRVCQPNCANAPAENSFSALTAFPPTTHFASADQLLAGSVIDDGPVSAGATAATSAHVSLTTSDSGSGIAETGTNSTFDFVAGSALNGQTLTVVFDYDARLFAQISADAQAGSLADVATSWQIQIRDLADNDLILNVSPAELQLQVAVDTLGTGPDDTGALSGSIVLTTTEALVAGRTYRVIIDHTTTASATLIVPEPETLALMAGGLVMLAFLGLYGRRPNDSLTDR